MWKTLDTVLWKLRFGDEPTRCLKAASALEEFGWTPARDERLLVLLRGGLRDFPWLRENARDAFDIL